MTERTEADIRVIEARGFGPPLTLEQEEQARSMSWSDQPLRNTHDVVTNPTEYRPTEFKVLVLPDPVVEVTKGGIIMPDSKKDSDKSTCVKGTILALAPLAFTYATEAEWGGKRPKAGDRIVYAKYSGLWLESEKSGQEVLVLNDKDIVSTIED